MMHGPRLRGAVTLAASVGLIVAALPAAAADVAQDPALAPGSGPTETAPAPVPLDRATEAEAEAVVETVVDGLEAAFEAAYLDEAATAEETVTEVLDDVVADTTAAESVTELAVAIDEEAAAVSELTIDEVTVERVGDVVPVAVDGSEVTVVGDVRITRHIAEDDVEWIEIIPHEVTVDTATGELTEVVAHDLEYQLEEVAEQEPDTQRLMRVPSDEPTTAVTGVALSATNRQKVANYATKWALSYNSAYTKYSVDCTNFVSQAMYAGGWKEVSHPWVDYKQDDAWWYGGIPTNSWTWSGAENFYRMTKALKRTTTAKYVSDLRVGDLLQYKNKGATNMTHSMVVTKKSGSTVYLSYHTTNTLNKPFSSLKGLNVTWYGHHV